MAQTAILSEQQKVNNWQAGYLWFVGLFYFFQGFFFQGTRIYVLTMMANWDVLTDTQATVFAILGLPGYFKVFPGILSDRLPVGRWGRRRPYIFIGGLFFIPGYLMLIRIQAFGMTWVASILLILFAWLLTDTTLDALTVDVTPQDRVGQVQGAVQSSRLAGGILGTLLVPLLGPRIGWVPVLITFAIGALVSSGSALLISELPISRDYLRKEQPIKNILQAAFSSRIVWLGLFFILFFSATQATGNLLSIYLLSELGWSEIPERMQTFALVTVFGTLASTVSAVITGRLRFKVLASFWLYVLFVIAFWVLTLPWLWVNRSPENLALVTLAQVSVGIGGGIGNVLSMVVAMRVCSKWIEGLTFALMMSAANFGALVIGAKTASAFVARLGGVIPAIFTLIPFGLVSLVFLYPLLRTINQDERE